MLEHRLLHHNPRTIIQTQPHRSILELRGQPRQVDAVRDDSPVLAEALRDAWAAEFSTGPTEVIPIEVPRVSRGAGTSIVVEEDWSAHIGATLIQIWRESHYRQLGDPNRFELRATVMIRFLDVGAGRPRPIDRSPEMLVEATSRPFETPAPVSAPAQLDPDVLLPQLAQRLRARVAAIAAEIRAAGD